MKTWSLTVALVLCASAVHAAEIKHAGGSRAVIRQPCANDWVTVLHTLKDNAYADICSTMGVKILEDIDSGSTVIIRAGSEGVIIYGNINGNRTNVKNKYSWTSRDYEEC